MVLISWIWLHRYNWTRTAFGEGNFVADVFPKDGEVHIFPFQRVRTAAESGLPSLT